MVCVRGQVRKRPVFPFYRRRDSQRCFVQPGGKHGAIVNHNFIIDGISEFKPVCHHCGRNLGEGNLSVLYGTSFQKTLIVFPGSLAGDELFLQPDSPNRAMKSNVFQLLPVEVKSGNRNRNSKGTSLIQFADKCDTTSMLFDDSVTNGKS